MFLRRKQHDIKSCIPCPQLWALPPDLAFGTDWMFFNVDPQSSPYCMTHSFNSSKTPIYVFAYVL